MRLSLPVLVSIAVLVVPSAEGNPRHHAARTPAHHRARHLTPEELYEAGQHHEVQAYVDYVLAISGTKDAARKQKYREAARGTGGNLTDAEHEAALQALARVLD